MIRGLSLIFGFATFQTVTSLSDVDKACINTFAGSFDNDFLIGNWYEVYKFSYMLNLSPAESCIKTVIKKPSSSEIQKYIDAYRLKNPYSFNDNPVLLDRDSGHFKGMLLGHGEVKFHVFDPETVFFKEDKYEARVYQKVNDDYILFQKCFMRGNTKWLMSRKNNITIEELDEVLKSVHPYVKRYQTQRFCA